MADLGQKKPTAELLSRWFPLSAEVEPGQEDRVFYSDQEARRNLAVDFFLESKVSPRVGAERFPSYSANRVKAFTARWAENYVSGRRPGRIVNIRLSAT